MFRLVVLIHGFHDANQGIRCLQQVVDSLAKPLLHLPCLGNPSDYCWERPPPKTEPLEKICDLEYIC